jgi:hypothetical protein
MAGAMAAQLGSSVRLLHVVDRALLIEAALGKTSEEVVQEAKQQLRALADEELQRVSHEVAVVVGVPADEILGAAETEGSELIIMALHEYKGLDRVLHRHTRCARWRAGPSARCSRCTATKRARSSRGSGKAARCPASASGWARSFCARSARRTIEPDSGVPTIVACPGRRRDGSLIGKPVARSAPHP